MVNVDQNIVNLLNQNMVDVDNNMVKVDEDMES